MVEEDDHDWDLTYIRVSIETYIYYVKSFDTIDNGDL